MKDSEYLYKIYDEKRKTYLCRSNSDNPFYKTKKGAEGRAKYYPHWVVQKFKITEVKQDD